MPPTQFPVKQGEKVFPHIQVIWGGPDDQGKGSKSRVAHVRQTLRPVKFDDVNTRTSPNLLPRVLSQCHFQGHCSLNNLEKSLIDINTSYNIVCKGKSFTVWITILTEPTLVLLPGKSHGWRSLVGCSPWGCWESDTTERLHFHSSLSCIGEGNGNPLQCSCLENHRDSRAWWAAVSGVAQSRTRLKRLSSSSSSSSISLKILH